MTEKLKDLKTIATSFLGGKDSEGSFGDVVCWFIEEASKSDLEELAKAIAKIEELSNER